MADRLLLRQDLRLAPADRHRALSLARDHAGRDPRGLRREIVTVSVRREAAGGKAGASFWALIRELDVACCRTPPAATPRATPSRPRSSRANSSTRLDQARGHRRRRHAAARCRRPRRGSGEPRQGRLRGVSLLHRGPRRGAAPRRCRLPRHHAMGVADRQRTRHRQRARAANCCAHACPTSRWWSMPGSARRRMRPTPWSWATTPCCSTPPSPRPAIRSRWRGAFRLAVECRPRRASRRTDGPARLRLPFNPCRWDTLLACRILTASIR